MGVNNESTLLGNGDKGKKRFDFYQKLREVILGYYKSKSGSNNKFIEYILLVPDMFYLLCKLTQDKNVCIAEKLKLVAAIAYFISPADFIPEGILGPIGYMDDLAIVAYVLDGLLNHVSIEVVKCYWLGDRDLLEYIQSILEMVADMIGCELWKKILYNFNSSKA